MPNMKVMKYIYLAFGKRENKSAENLKAACIASDNEPSSREETID